MCNKIARSVGIFFCMAGNKLPNDVKQLEECSCKNFINKVWWATSVLEISSRFLNLKFFFGSLV